MLLKTSLYFSILFFMVLLRGKKSPSLQSGKKKWSVEMICQLLQNNISFKALILEEYTLCLSADGEGCGSMLVEYHIARGFNSGIYNINTV